MPAPDGPTLDLGRLIAALDQHGVEYLLCGGAAATAYGAQRPTEDADCVVSRERTNLERLAQALAVTVLGKGSKLAVIPLPPRVARAVDLAAGNAGGGRCS